MPAHLAMAKSQSGINCKMDVLMTDTPSSTANDTPNAANGYRPEKKEDSFPVFLIKLVLIVVIFRSFIFSPFNIPSESMQPKLVDGDYLLAAKWPYGYSSYSLPYSVPLLPSRILPHQPKRGDVVIFKAPPNQEADWIKRVIGLPGDTIQMIGGVLQINGKPIQKQRIADFEIAVSPNTKCFIPQYEVTKPDGTQVCHYPQFRETIPAMDDQPGKIYTVLDLANTNQDNTAPVIVPEGTLFLMGDNRDNSTDSRFPTSEGGIALVPQENLVGRATVMMWSTDGSMVWYKPWTWFTAARWNRIGTTF
jgi:signal peptidase I